MKYPFLIVFLIATNALTSQITSQWTGYFEGTILGLTAPMQGEAKGNAWTGLINVNGYVLNLHGTIIGDQCDGTMADPQTQSSIPFRSQLAGKLLTVKIHDINPLTGREEDMELVFEKLSDTAPTSGTSSTTQTNFKIEKGTLDQTLVGRWRYTDSYVSGDFSFATDWFMNINSDGSLLYTDGRTAGGGSNSSIDSGDGDVHEVSWKAENKIIYLNAGQGWQEYARYYKEGNNLMLTYGSGSKQVWEKY
ncbi:MAG: hypothetical protein M3R25_00425 [Bacteroidota bacterium]|nr:hypothetical protein [Bacteroidota bacterium]